MKMLVCGGREFSNYTELQRILDGLHSLEPVDMLIHGGALGADRLAARWAFSRKVVAVAFPADWEKHGKAAGPMRNQRMLEEKPDMVVAFPGGRGTADMVRRAKKAGVPINDYSSASCTASANSDTGSAGGV